MADPFLAEIRLVSFSFPPKGWAFCDGQLMSINQNQALFSLLGTTYGGDGRVNFGLPDLRGRVPIHMGSGHTLGERGGEVNHTVTMSETPTHTHALMASKSSANTATPAGYVLAAQSSGLYRNPTAATLVTMNPNMVSPLGGGQMHANLQPYLTLTFCIALQGIFPSQN